MTKWLWPEDAASTVVRDIMKDDDCRKAMLEIATRNGFSDYELGNTILNEIYGTPLEGKIPDLERTFTTNVYDPLNFRLKRKYNLVMPEMLMIKEIGKLARVYADKT